MTHAQSSLLRFGDFVLVTVHVEGAAPGLAHAQHIHGIGMHMCPAGSADILGPSGNDPTNLTEPTGIATGGPPDGLINTTEGLPAYGPIVVSLTTSGDTSAASGLATDRFPVADANGTYDYSRLLRIGAEIPRDVADNLDAFAVVTHGIDTNHNGAYDFSKGVSDLDPTLPEEATVPSACGLISSN